MKRKERVQSGRHTEEQVNREASEHPASRRARELHAAAGKGRRFAPSSEFAPLLDAAWTKRFVEALSVSVIPMGAVAEQLGVSSERLRRWLHDGRKFLAECQGGERLTAQALLAQDVDAANAKRLEKVVREMYDAGPRDRSHSFGQWVAEFVSPRHLGVHARRHMEREEALADVAANLKAPAGANVISEEMANKSDDELIQELKG